MFSGTGATGITGATGSTGGTGATGGIGGVHRGAELSFDVSADLLELARTDVIVVCAGAKAILDLPKTLEVLETHGVSVIGYQCDELPAFWSRQSGLAAPLRLDSPAEICRHAKMRRDLQISGGTLIANPIPPESEIPANIINSYIETALAAAETEKVSGKDVTPYLLSKIVDLSDGESLQANIALITNNARLAAQIAVELAKN